MHNKKTIFIFFLGIIIGIVLTFLIYILTIPKSINTSSVKILVTMYKNDKEKLEKESYFKSLKNLDQILFVDLDNDKIEEAVTNTHSIEVKTGAKNNKYNEYTQIINIYKKEGTSWGKKFSYNLGATSVLELDWRGYIFDAFLAYIPPHLSPVVIVRNTIEGNGAYTNYLFFGFKNNEFQKLYESEWFSISEKETVENIMRSEKFKNVLVK